MGVRRLFLPYPNGRPLRGSGGFISMKSLLIKDTTLEERKQIVQESLSFSAGDCDDQDFSDIYDDYILGLRELADINREFSEKHAGEVM